MLKSLQFLRISIFIFICNTSVAQTLYLSGKIEGTNITQTSIKKMVKNSADENYVIGSFLDSIHLDLVSGGFSVLGGNPGISHGFLAQYDPSGNIMWGFGLGNINDSLIINDVVSDFTGSVYIGGTFYGTVDFNPLGAPFNLTATVGGDGFIARYDGAGNLMFAIQLENNGPNASVNNLAVNSLDYVYAGGYFNDTMDVDPGAPVVNLVSTSGTLDGFVAVYDDSGNYLSSYLFNGAGDEEVTVVTTGSADEVIVAGKFDADINLGAGGAPQIFTTNGLTDIFLGSYDLSMAYVMGTNIGGAEVDVPIDVLAMSFEVILLAEYDGSVDFNPLGASAILNSTAGSTDVSILKYDYWLTNYFAKSVGNSGVNRAYFLAPESGVGASKSVNQLYTFSMNFSGTLDVDPGPAVNNISSTNTPINSVLVTVNDTGTYVTHAVIEAKTCTGISFNSNNIRDITLVGDFSGTNVDLLPLDSIAYQIHTVNYAGYYIFYNRCNMTVDGSVSGTYECGTCTATLTCQPTGGITPYTFSWSNGDYVEYTQTAGGACGMDSAYYSINLSDFFGCDAMDSVFIYEHAPGAELGANVIPVATSCGNNFGSATASPINALGPVTYYWYNGENTNAVDSLLAGNYFVQITDSLQCYVEVMFNIDNSDGPSIAIDSASNPNCGGIASGFVNVTISGGAAPYTFLWSNGATTEDLAGVSGGTYSLIVTDAAGCENQICLSLYEPNPVTVGFNGSLYANCFANDGTLFVLANGGYTPYTYQWDAAAFSQTNDTAVGLFAGMYSVVVTDSIGCTATGNFGVSDFTGPWPYVWTTGNPTCSGATGYFDMDVFGSGPYSYQWSSGETTEDIYNVAGGDYLLQVTDIFGCIGVYSGSLFQQVPYSPKLCMVTVDSLGIQNVVVWDKTSNPEAAYFNIYREGVCNVYDFGKVGITDYDSLSVFYDTVVNSDTRSWRYYVTCVDTCGYESWPSDIIKTMHLSAAFDASFDVQLQWNEFDGYPVTAYDIYRKNVAGTAFDYVDSVDALSLSYVDTINFSAYSEVEYFVEARTDFVCSASRAYNQNSARSNHPKALVVEDTTGSAIQPITDLFDETIKIYPNPTNDLVFISIISDQSSAYHVDVIDQVGKIVKSTDMLYRTSFSTRDLHSGIYFIRMRNDKQGVKTFKLVVSR